MGAAAEAWLKTFQLVLIKPSHYDDDGYVIQWFRAPVPSNSLAALYGLAQDCADRHVLGADVELRITAYDECSTRIRPEAIAAGIRRAGAGMVGLVGVQSNQFPRAMDLARRFRAAGVPVVIGGFHVSGCISMLPALPPELQEAIDSGISLFAGEAEGRLDGVLQDAFRGTLKPIYNHLADLPELRGAPTPFLPAETVSRTALAYASFDAGRGCPFQCSFCTIINVQGRKSRYRSADDVERLVRAQLAQGVRRFFITDDNFARNRNWEAIFDRLAAIRAEGRNIKFIIQVDTLCHKIPNFIEKAGAAGVREVFIGMENINPETLLAAKKRQNKITEYRRMLQAWHRVGTITYGGYILGFPADTPESIARDIGIIQRELPIDFLEFFVLTPLPGSEDHATLHRRGEWMDPDLNKYDVEHVTTAHPRMSAREWQETYWRAWRLYYTPKHIERVFRRAGAHGRSTTRMVATMLWFCGAHRFDRIHPLDAGIWRRKYRRDRRPGLPLESPFIFYPKYLWQAARKHAWAVGTGLRFLRLHAAIKKDPASRHYTDLSLTPVSEEELERLELFTASDAASAAVERARRLQQAPAKVPA